MPVVRNRRESALKDYLGVVAALPQRSPDERKALAQQLALGDAGAGLALMESYLGLVVREAAKQRGLGARFDALIAAGNRALAAELKQTPLPDDARLLRAVRQGLKDQLAKPSRR